MPNRAQSQARTNGTADRTANGTAQRATGKSDGGKRARNAKRADTANGSSGGSVDTSASARATADSEPAGMVSVNVRHHRSDRAHLLNEALISLVGQSYAPLEVIVSVQSFDGSEIDDLQALIDGLPLRRGIEVRISNVDVPEGVDGRSMLSNNGIKEARGRYYANLDYDDLVYGNIYTTLVKELNDSDTAIAIGGVMRSDYKAMHGSRYVKKRFPIFENVGPYDFFEESCIPIHSYVIDMEKVDRADMVFPEDMSKNEDYVFLLRLMAKYPFSMEKQNVPVCEYMVDVSGSNTILAYNSSGSARRDWMKAEATVQAIKRDMTITLPMTDFLDLQRRANAPAHHPAPPPPAPAPQADVMLQGGHGAFLENMLGPRKARKLRQQPMRFFQDAWRLRRERVRPKKR